jgi:hypothetical protein
LLEKRGDYSRVRTKGSKFVVAVLFTPTQDTIAVDPFTRVLLQPRLAAVGHGLVERLEVFKGGLVALLRCLTKVFVEPPLGRG